MSGPGLRHACLMFGPDLRHASLEGDRILDYASLVGGCSLNPAVGVGQSTLLYALSMGSCGFVRGSCSGGCSLGYGACISSSFPGLKPPLIATLTDGIADSTGEPLNSAHGEVFSCASYALGSSNGKVFRCASYALGSSCGEVSYSTYRSGGESSCSSECVTDDVFVKADEWRAIEIVRCCGIERSSFNQTISPRGRILGLM